MLIDKTTPPLISCHPNLLNEFQQWSFVVSVQSSDTDRLRSYTWIKEMWNHSDKRINCLCLRLKTWTKWCSYFCYSPFGSLLYVNIIKEVDSKSEGPRLLVFRINCMVLWSYLSTHRSTSICYLFWTLNNSVYS